MAHPEARPLRARACPSRDPARGGPGAPRLQRPAGPGLRSSLASHPAGTGSRGRALRPLQSEMRTRGRGGWCERADTCRPQPPPARAAFAAFAAILREARRRGSRRKSSGRHHREPAGGSALLPRPCAARGLARPAVPGALGAAAAAPGAGTSGGNGGGREPAGGGSAAGPPWERLAPSPTPSAGTRRRAGGSAPQLWGFMALLLLEGRSGSEQAGAAQPGRGGAVSRWCRVASQRPGPGGRAGGACGAAPQRPRRNGGGARPRGPAGAPSPPLCVTDCAGIACNSLVWKGLVGSERFAGPLLVWRRLRGDRINACKCLQGGCQTLFIGALQRDKEQWP